MRAAADILTHSDACRRRSSDPTGSGHGAASAAVSVNAEVTGCPEVMVTVAGTGGVVVNVTPAGALKFTVALPGARNGNCAWKIPPPASVSATLLVLASLAVTTALKSASVSGAPVMGGMLRVG